MHKNIKSQRIKHLYNPQLEGIGSYDVHYINANIKKKRMENEIKQKDTDRERYAA